MSQGWTFLNNPFESGTRRNYSRAGKIARNTSDQLAAQAANNTAIADLYRYFNPINAAYQQSVTAWIAAGGDKEGATLNLKQLERTINTDVKDWEQSIKNTYMPGTPGYEAIFPQGTTYLKRGKRQDRIDRLTAFSLALDSSAVFRPVKDLVDRRISELERTSTDQSGKKGLTKTGSDAVEAARIAVCTGLYYVLGGLMQQYADNPANIAAYFDLTTLRDLQQHTFTGPVPAGTTRYIAERSLPATGMVTLTNEGTTELAFYLGAAAAAAFNPNAPFVKVEPGDTVTVAAAALGNAPADAFLMVMNTSRTAGHWTVEL